MAVSFLAPAAETVGPSGHTIVFFWRKKILATKIILAKNFSLAVGRWQLAGGIWPVAGGSWQVAGKLYLQVNFTIGGMWPNCLGAVRKTGIRCPPPAGSGEEGEFLTEEQQQQQQEEESHLF